jgi:hypothetical protein
VPVDVNEGAGGDVHYVTVEQGPGQSPEDCLTACANEGKPRFVINPCLFKFMQLSLLFYVHLRSGIELNPSCMIPRCLCSFTSILGR